MAVAQERQSVEAEEEQPSHPALQAKKWQVKLVEMKENILSYLSMRTH